MFDACLTAPDPGFRVIYGISANTRAWWDLAPGRAIGFDPLDDAEQWAEQVLTDPATPTDDAEGAHVGGPLTFEEHYRPAL